MGLQLYANSTTEDVDAVSSLTEEVDLEAATLHPHCGLACWGGRRLLTSNMSDEELKAAGCRWACWGGRRLQLDANSASQDMVAGSSITEAVDLEAATLHPHCGLACWGGRRLETSNISGEELKAGRCRWACWGGRRLQPDANSTTLDVGATSSSTDEEPPLSQSV